ncbi:MAG TPA: sugar ABC transporter permease [Candidatus Limiplasma sp.]|nr:sugar ABC transporter permease [Candidatus Limiplasma sp.]
MAQNSQAAPRRRMSKLQRKNTLIAYSFLAPNFIGFIIITMAPILFSIVLSFINWNGGVLENMSWAGLDNFREIFTNFNFKRSDLGITLKNTVLYALATVPLTIVFALSFAMLLNKAVKGASFFRFVFFFPYVASIVAVCACWNYLLMKYGIVNTFLNSIGFNFTKSWTQSRSLAMWALIIVAVWRGAGYYMIMYIAGLQNIPNELYEAATVDGAKAFQKFWKITLPMLTPTTFFVTIMTTIQCFKVFDTVVLMTEGGPGRATKMLVNYIFDLSFNQIKYGVASAVAMVLFVVVLLITIFQFRAEKKWVNYF